MKQPLVSPLDRNATPQAEEMARFYEETLGFTPNSLFTMMHRPRIARAFLEMNQAVMENKGRVSSALKREIAYLSSMTTGCRYCEAHAIRAAERYGSSEDRMNHIWEYKTYAAFTEGERAAFDLAIAVHKFSLHNLDAGIYFAINLPSLTHFRFTTSTLELFI